MNTKTTTPTTAERIARAIANSNHVASIGAGCNHLGEDEPFISLDESAIARLIDTELERERQQVREALRAALSIIPPQKPHSPYVADKCREEIVAALAMLEPSREGR